MITSCFIALRVNSKGLSVLNFIILRYKIREGKIKRTKGRPVVRRLVTEN